MSSRRPFLIALSFDSSRISWQEADQMVHLANTPRDEQKSLHVGLTGVEECDGTLV